MSFDHVTDFWMETASREEMYDVCDEMERELDSIEYGSDEYRELYFRHVDLVNAIASRFPLNLPKREHGWYLPNDD